MPSIMETKIANSEFTLRFYKTSSFRSFHLFTSNIGLSSNRIAFPDALSCSVSAFKVVLDNGARAEWLRNVGTLA